MNSYDDPSSARGRANIPGPADDHGRGSEAGWPANGDGYGAAGSASPPRLASSGRASAGSSGRASVGSASVGSSGSSAGRASVGSAPAGRAQVGRATVGAGAAGAAGAGGAGGAAGRAQVGRATVRPVSPAGPGAGADVIEVPGGPTGSKRRGGRGAPLDPAAKKKAKRRKRVNLLVAAFAVLVMLAGAAVVGLTWFYDDVPEYSTAEAEANSIVYANGAEMAKLGEVNRVLVPYDKISPVVRRAVMAAEDKNFMDHEGIDMKGIARAAWNNFTGGDTQGASTITQQYARHAAELTGINYNRKIREAVLARKLEERFSKDEILGFYLNAIYFGRGAYGIEAAAKAFFGPNRSVLVQPGQKGALTPEEAAVLAAVIKQPEPAGKTGHQGYDPQVNLTDAQQRWSYTLSNMVEKGWLSAEAKAAAKYPTVAKYDPKKCNIDCGIDKPTGNVVNYVRDELEEMGIPKEDWVKGGYKITTTIDKRAQDAAQNAARRASKSSPMNGLPKHYQAALVAIEPETGRVLAYYGGENGTGTDFAGLNGDGTGPHAPASSFKIYTLAAALREGIMIDSRWDAEKTENKYGRKIRNAGRENLPCGQSCTLEESTIQSYNVPFYWIADGIGPAKVVAAARDAGITTMKDVIPGQGKPRDLTKPEEVAPKYFDSEVGFGQYPITVLDHANGVATFANRGVYNKAHFIRSVEKRNPVTGKYEKVAGAGEKRKPEKRFLPEQIDDLNSVLKKIPGSVDNTLSDGRPAIGKTGTWELNDTTRQTGDAWMVGASRQIAAAVWVGTSGDRRAIEDPDGSNMGGGDTPALIWEKFMEAAHEAMKLPNEDFPDRKNTGNPDSPYPNGVEPSPSQGPGQNDCILPPVLCGNPNGNGNGNGNNDDDDNDGAQQTIPPPDNDNDNNNENNDNNTLPGQGGGVLLSPSPRPRE